ncbi:MAG: DUF3568 family protein [Burkholderiales bacterium]|nr:DUF3568 family protein [Burkholderiales bacterium]
MILGICCTLAGCEALALTALGIGASTGVSHSLSGITYRTFSEPIPRVRGASLKALQRMQIKVASTGKIDNGESIKANASDREINIELEALSPNTTRMRVTASSGLFRDSATATEIIIQTERYL